MGYGSKVPCGAKSQRRTQRLNRTYFMIRMAKLRTSKIRKEKKTSPNDCDDGGRMVIMSLIGMRTVTDPQIVGQEKIILYTVHNSNGINTTNPDEKMIISNMGAMIVS